MLMVLVHTVMGFNRRQEGIIQYMGSTGPLSYRFAFTQGEREKHLTGGTVSKS